MESLFEFLFKYRPFFFGKGKFVFQWGLEGWQALALLAAIAAAVLLLYRRRWAGSGTGRLLIGLRAAFLMLLALLAMRPSLVLSSLVPRENMLAVLVDNSKSMGIQDQLEPRGQPVSELLQPDAEFVAALEDKFYLRAYRFGARAEGAPLPLQLDWSGDQTGIAGGLEKVLAETRNLPLAGVVLFSDGSDNSYRSFNPAIAELSARQIPVYVVGIGPERVEKDVEITQVSVPRSLIPESVASARVTLRQEGFGGSRSRLEVREGATLVQTQEVYFPRDSDTVTVEVAISPKTQGIKTYQFTLQPLEGERIDKNNSVSTIIQVRDDRPRILYVEGQPRWEFKFIRQAMAKDQNIHLETLLRTAHNKLYRQGIQEETTLAAGFPSEREELFEYKGVILGSIESSFFTYHQMELIKDFVSKRGGGFMMLGGSSSFDQGGYQNTPVGQILPVVMRAPAKEESGSQYAQGHGVFGATLQGQNHPALSLSLDARTNRRTWAEMPPLTDWNRVSDMKPGATVLARMDVSSPSGESKRGLPLLAFQRFGRGQAIALLTGSSWRWQMQRDSEDQSHETFWRQTLRWLISLSKDVVAVETERESYSRNETVRIRAEVNDKAFTRINDARVEATVVAPSGAAESFPLRWTAEEDGVYEGEWTPQEDGLHRIEVEAEKRAGRKSESYGSARASFLTATGAREYFEPAQRKEFLQRLAKDTGGAYYTMDDVANLPEEIVYTERKSSVVEVFDLWDMPILFILLTALLLGEWFLRRRHGAI